MGKTPDYVAAGIHEVIEVVNTFPLLRELTVPVLLLSGDKKKVTLDMQREMEREIPDVELRVFEGIGTALGTVAPHLVAAAALDFWSRVEARATVA
jgi:pimeloyl-ACP methyl ester carboxylesterase